MDIRFRAVPVGCPMLTEELFDRPLVALNPVRVDAGFWITVV